MEATVPVGGSSAEGVESGEGLLTPLFGSSSTIHHHQSDAPAALDSAATPGSQNHYVIHDDQASDEINQQTDIKQPEITNNDVAVAQPPKRPRGPPPKRIPTVPTPVSVNVINERDLIRGLGHDADNLSFYGIDSSISEMLIEGMERTGEEERQVSFNLGMNSQFSPTLTHELVSSVRGTGNGHHEMWPDEESHDVVDAADDITSPVSSPVSSPVHVFGAEGGEWLDENMEIPLEDLHSSSSSSSSGRALWYSGMDDDGNVCYYHRITGEARYDDPFAEVSTSPVVPNNPYPQYDDGPFAGGGIELAAALSDDDYDMTAVTPIPTELAEGTTIPPPPDAADLHTVPHTTLEYVDESLMDVQARDGSMPDTATAPSYITPISPDTYASSHDVSVGYEEGTMYKGNIAPPAVTNITGDPSTSLQLRPPHSLIYTSYYTCYVVLII